MKVFYSLKTVILGIGLMLLMATNISSQCTADFVFAAYEGPMPVVGGIAFENLSEGPYTAMSWDFGDGQYFTDVTDTHTHFYAESGVYTVKLSVWGDNPDVCFSEVTQQVNVFISDDPCDQLDCVWPGDTNDDGRANLEDLINIGMGFGMTGPARDVTGNEWDAHLAMDWDQTTPDGINYKHLDCNGDGIINHLDVSPVNQNYVLMENGVSITESGAAPLFLEFDADTITITSDTEPSIEINAALLFGHTDFPLSDVYGVVFYLEYPGEKVDSSSFVTMSYNETSFFGGLDNTLPFARDDREAGQIDAVVTRKTGFGTSGFGRLANFKFIVDSDIIDGREIQEGVPFTVKIKVVKAIATNGDEIDVSLSEEPASVIFVNGVTTTKTKEVNLSDKVTVFPNPVTTNLQIDLGDLDAEQVELYNLLGQRVTQQAANRQVVDMNVSNLESGVYLLHIQTEAGIATKRVVIE